MKDQCRAAVAAKQELADSARALLRSNRDQLAALGARSGAPAHADADVVAAFDAAVGEWDRQLRRRGAGGAEGEAAGAKGAGGGNGGSGGAFGRRGAGAGHYSTDAVNAALARSNLH